MPTYLLNIIDEGEFSGMSEISPVTETKSLTSQLEQWFQNTIINRMAGKCADGK